MAEYFLYKTLFYYVSLSTFLLRLVWYLEGPLEAAGQYSQWLKPYLVIIKRTKHITPYTG